MGLLAKATAIREHLEKQQAEQAAMNMAINQLCTDFAADLLASVETGEIESAPQREVKFHDEALNRMYTRAFTPQPMPLMTTKNQHQRTVKKPHPKLRKFAAVLGMGLLLNTASSTISNRGEVRTSILNKKPIIELTNEIIFPATPAQEYADAFGKNLGKSRVSSAERDMLARMVYGEAGRGADIFEVIHTVLNRMSSPLFDNTVSAVVTQKNQFVGYSPNHPIDPVLRQMVDFAVDEWEAHDCQPIKDCNHFYFVTGDKGKNPCNKFEISPDGKGTWVPADKKQYAPLRHYCDVATDQYTRFKNQPAQEVTR